MKSRPPESPTFCRRDLMQLAAAGIGAVASREVFSAAIRAPDRHFEHGQPLQEFARPGRISTTASRNDRAPVARGRHAQFVRRYEALHRLWWTDLPQASTTTGRRDAWFARWRWIADGGSQRGYGALPLQVAY
jgi:hypothetical protein